MIVKILSSAKNFEGIDYSERKNDQGKSRLLKAENFGALGHQAGETKKEDYINYMKLVSDANLRVKKRQFHAVLSAKGKSHAPEELASIAEQYLKHMGYGENPYLIYYHGDTNNNHVHMVSTRVDKNGKKVNDSYENIRSQKALLQILHQDPGMEAKSAMEDALGFLFSTKAQFKLLLEDKGFKAAEKEDQIQLIKYGVVQGSIPHRKLENKIADYIPHEDRIKQLQAIFFKYKKGLEMEVFKEKIHQKFGLKIILHQEKNHKQPYGYTIIDYPKRQVFKGSQIVPLKHLLLPVTRQGKKQLLDEYLNKENLGVKTYFSLRKDLTKMGFHLNKSGGISSADDREVLFILNSEDLKKMKYNTRLAVASKYATHLDEERNLLAKLYHVKPAELNNKLTLNKETESYYRDLLLHGSQSSSFHEILIEKQLEVLKYKQKYFLLDLKKHQLLSIRRLIGDNKLDLGKARINSIDAFGTIDIAQSINATNTLSQLTQLFDLSIAESDRGNNQHRKKRKQRKF